MVGHEPVELAPKRNGSAADDAEWPTDGAKWPATVSLGGIVKCIKGEWFDFDFVVSSLRTAAGKNAVELDEELKEWTLLEETIFQEE